MAGELILQMFDAGLQNVLSIQDIVMPLHPDRYYIKDPLSRENKHTNKQNLIKRMKWACLVQSACPGYCRMKVSNVEISLL